MRYSLKLVKLCFLGCFAAFLSCACVGRGKSSQTQQALPDTSGPKRYSYEIVNVYPHNTSSFTQGLYWHDGFLWEGTGEYGRSRLMKVDLQTGQIIKSVKLDNKYFGEGIALLNDKIYQLTWLERKMLTYDADNQELIEETDISTQGWGLATDGEMLYASDGSDKIYILNPTTFEVTRTLNVRMGSRPIKFINEMEWIEGNIWANIYMTDTIAIIDPQTGNILGIVDLSNILPSKDITRETDVLNGIAYDHDSKRIFVTGKNWNKLFEIKIKEK